jgi:hypothetical protein
MIGRGFVFIGAAGGVSPAICLGGRFIGRAAGCFKGVTRVPGETKAVARHDRNGHEEYNGNYSLERVSSHRAGPCFH